MRQELSSKQGFQASYYKEYNGYLTEKETYPKACEKFPTAVRNSATCLNCLRENWGSSDTSAGEVLLVQAGGNEFKSQNPSKDAEQGGSRM